MRKENWTDYIQIGIELCVSVLFFTAIGFWGDLKFKTKPYLTLIGAFLGIISVFYILWRKFLRGHDE